jgi:hypothetical protein
VIALFKDIFCVLFPVAGAADVGETTGRLRKGAKNIGDIPACPQQTFSGGEIINLL